MNRRPSGARQTRRTISQSFVSAGFQNIQNIPQKQTAPATQPEAAAVATAEATPEVKSPPPPPVISAEPPQSNHNTEDLDLGQDDTMSSGDGKVLFKKIFVTRKKSSIRAREKKMRQNRQLRKSILPKNALMALNEIKGIIIGDFNIYQNETGFAAIMTVNNVQYEGSGVSKAAAKNDACEKALRDYILAKLIKHPRLPRKPTAKTTSTASVTSDGKPDDEPEPEAEQEQEQQPEMEDEGHDESMDCADGDGDEADDIPMVNLASFAIYKLFSEWESAGFCIPDMHPPTTNETSASSEPKPPPKPTVRNELPANYQDMHPATLLCIMRPGLTYTDIGCVGENPNILHQVKCTVDGQEFTAAGRSKKLARRFCAIQVCNTLFNTNFEQMEE